MASAPLISVVIPIYRAGCLKELYHRLTTSLTAIGDDFEIVMVNDASPDQTWDVIVSLARIDFRVRGIDLETNVGQHVAILAGLDHATGQWVVVMDSDLQDRPEEIPRLFEVAAKEGFDIVQARRAVRWHSLWRRLGSQAFYTVLGSVTDIAQDPSVANFGIYRRAVIQAILAIRERYYFPLLVRTVGFRLTSIDVEHGARRADRSSYSLAKLLKLAFIGRIGTLVSKGHHPFRIPRRSFTLGAGHGKGS